MKLSEIIGWVGMVLVLTMYGLAANGILLATSFVFNIFNMFGAVFLGISAFATKNWSIVALNIVWCVLAITSFLK